MPYSPLVSKIRCHNPNKSNSVFANRNYLTYIATREGVDIGIGITEEDYIEEMINDSSSNDKYLEYISNRPKSHGLFGNIDTNNLDEAERKVIKLSDQGKCIYRGIVSLSQKDAEALDFTCKENWEVYLNQVMPDIVKTLGLSISNYSWVAAFHAEKEHPHVHYMLWENIDKVRSPYIHKSVQHECRKILSDAMFNEEYENMIKEVYKSERDELNSIRNDNRKELTDITKDLMEDVLSFVPGVVTNKLPDRIHVNEIYNLSKDIISLSNKLPIKGSIDYKYLQPKLKDTVDNITRQLLSRHDMRKEYDSYINAVEEGNKLIGKTSFEIDIAKEKASNDIFNRIGNIIIKSAKNIKTNNIDTEKALGILESQHFNKSNKIIDKDIFVESQIDYPEELLEDKLSINDTNLTYHCSWTNEYKLALKCLYDPEFQNFDKAFAILRNEANTKNVLAIHDLGKMFEKGIGRDIDTNLAEKFFKESFNGFNKIEELKPNAYIEYRIGKFYDYGKGTEKNINNAAHWYRLSSSKENKFAQFSLGKIYFKEKGIPEAEKETFDFKKSALNLFHKSDLKENAYAAYELGVMYKKGIGTDINNKESNYFFSKAFNTFKNYLNEKEDDNLLYRVGKMYLEGNGVDKSETIGIEYLEKAAKLNNENAQYTLAKIYIESPNLDSEKIETAISWLTKLSEKENSMAQYCLGKLYLEGLSIEQDTDKAIDLLEKSSSKDNSFAQYTLGKLYYEGIHVEQDLEKALSYLNSSSEENNDFAQYTLGKLYSDVNTPYYDIDKSISWLNKSIENGNNHALFYLGKLYEEPTDYFDIDKAVRLITKSAEAGNMYAQCHLGNLYLWGNKIDKNEELGIYWLKKSIEQGNEFAEKSLQTYYDFKQNVPSLTYGIFKMALGTLSNKNNQERSNLSEHRLRSKNKAALKEQMLHHSDNANGREN